MNVQEGEPALKGLYVAYVDDEHVTRFAKRTFLMWMGQWSYPGSDQNFRGHVYGWVGPLPAMALET
jgi:hypothetical protein